MKQPLILSEKHHGRGDMKIVCYLPVQPYNEGEYYFFLEIYMYRYSLLPLPDAANKIHTDVTLTTVNLILKGWLSQPE